MVPPNSRRVVSTSTRLAVETVKSVEEAVVVVEVVVAKAVEVVVAKVVEVVVAIGPAPPAVAVAPAKVAKAVTAHRPKVVVAVPTTAEAATVKVAAVAPIVAMERDVDVPKTDPDTTALPKTSKVVRESAPPTTTVARPEKADSRESLVRSGTPWTSIPELSERRSRERAVTGKEAPARTRTKMPLPPL